MSEIREATGEPAPRTYCGYAPYRSNFADLVSAVLQRAYDDLDPVTGDFYDIDVKARFGLDDEDHTVTVHVWS